MPAGANSIATIRCTGRCAMPRSSAGMAAFGTVLPAILDSNGIRREKVLATVVRLLERTAIRVGNEEYAKTNNSYGLTTLKDKHVEVKGYTQRFHFRGKSGLVHDLELTDRKLAKIVRECQEIPGRELFHYVSESGEIGGQDFTAKDFRTWVGTSQMALELDQIGPAASAADTKKNIVAAIKKCGGQARKKAFHLPQLLCSSRHPGILYG